MSSRQLLVKMRLAVRLNQLAMGSQACHSLSRSIGLASQTNRDTPKLAAMGKKAGNNLTGIDIQPVKLLLGGIIIGNGFCYR